MSTSTRLRALLSLVVAPAMFLAACSTSHKDPVEPSATTEGDKITTTVEPAASTESPDELAEKGDPDKNRAIKTIVKASKDEMSNLVTQFDGLYSSIDLSAGDPYALVYTYQYADQLDPQEARGLISEGLDMLDSAQLCDETFGPIEGATNLQGPWTIVYVYNNADGSEILSDSITCE